MKTKKNPDYKFDSETGTILKYLGSKKRLIIPSKINGIVVEKIGKWAFRNCVFLKELTIPDTVVEIGNHAFDNCQNLVVCNLPYAYSYSNRANSLVMGWDVFKNTPVGLEERSLNFRNFRIKCDWDSRRHIPAGVDSFFITDEKKMKKFWARVTREDRMWGRIVLKRRTRNTKKSTTNAVDVKTPNAVDVKISDLDNLYSDLSLQFKGMNSKNKNIDFYVERYSKASGSYKETVKVLFSLTFRRSTHIEAFWEYRGSIERANSILKELDAKYKDKFEIFLSLCTKKDAQSADDNSEPDEGAEDDEHYEDGEYGYSEYEQCLEGYIEFKIKE